MNFPFLYFAGIFSFYITASLWSGGHSKAEAVEVPLVTSRTTATTLSSMTEKVLTTREIEDVVYQTVYACQDDILQVIFFVVITSDGLGT